MNGDDPVAEDDSIDGVARTKLVGRFIVVLSCLSPFLSFSIPFVDQSCDDSLAMVTFTIFLSHKDWSKEGGC